MRINLVITLLIFLLPLINLGCTNNNSTFQNTFINQVYDGDTFTTNDNNKLRLFGIDTPELTTGAPQYNPTVGLEYLYALEAKKYAETQINKKQVVTELITIDKYERFVVKVFYKQDLGLELVTQGLARVAYISLDIKSPYFSNDYQYYQKLLLAQYQAYQAEIGIWAFKKDFKIIFPKAN